jgi:hypothetical protein
MGWAVIAQAVDKALPVKDMVHLSTGFTGNHPPALWRTLQGAPQAAPRWLGKTSARRSKCLIHKCCPPVAHRLYRQASTAAVDNPPLRGSGGLRRPDPA